MYRDKARRIAVNVAKLPEYYAERNAGTVPISKNRRTAVGAA